ncbi:33992_t:CDS:2, partial [Gigaspora margarita]
NQTIVTLAKEAYLLEVQTLDKAHQLKFGYYVAKNLTKVQCEKNIIFKEARLAMNKEDLWNVNEIVNNACGRLLSGSIPYLAIQTINDSSSKIKKTIINCLNAVYKIMIKSVSKAMRKLS